jgi:hypothetical protein
MKPRLRYSPLSRRFYALTHDGWLSIPVSGSEALSSLGRGAPGVLSLSERHVVIADKLYAVCPMMHRTRNEPDLAGGEDPRPLSVPPISHVSLPHEEHTATLHFAEAQNVHA